MSRPRKPARLYFSETDDVWCIRDGTFKQRLGLRKEQHAEAEARHEAYLTAKRSQEKPLKGRRADRVSCAEVLARYAEKATVKRPPELAARIDKLLDFWGDLTLDDIDEDSCGEYVDFVGSPASARRSLEDFRAAVNSYARAGFLRDMVKFSLPEKPRGRVDFLTFEEAIALCRTAWGYREVQQGKATRRWPTRQVAKFIAVGIATCSRSARIYEASYVAEPGRPFVDMVNGVFYRSAPDERVAANKKAPPITMSPRLVASMRRWTTSRVLWKDRKTGKVTNGDRYVCEWAGHAADTKKAFASTVERARVRYPHLLKRSDGTPKLVVRHILRHTGVTWLAQAGVDPYQICGYAGLTIETFERVYAHHHPDYQAGVRKAQSKKERALVVPPTQPLLLPAPSEMAEAAE